MINDERRAMSEIVGRVSGLLVRWIIQKNLRVVGDRCFGRLEFVIQEGLYFAIAEFDG